MGESDRYQEYKHLKKKKLLLGSDNNALTALLIINAIFFLVILTMQVVYFFNEQSAQDFNNDIIRFFSLPANLNNLAGRPWTVLTYMFSDTGNNIMRIVSNMVWLWAFGYILQQMTENDKIIPIYIYGGVMGAVFFIGAHYFISPLHNNMEASLIGANASSMAVATATTFLSPDYRFFRQIRKGIPIWVLLTIYIFIDFSGVASMGAAYSLSHLGGALAGLLFVLLLRKGKDSGAWMNKLYNLFINLFKPSVSNEKKDIKNKIFYATEGRKPFNKKAVVNQNRVDQILDKINSKGYEFLTDEEKEILKKAAEDDSI